MKKANVGKILLALGIFIVDRISKHIIFTTQPNFEIIPGILNITIAYNKGFAFGLGQNLQPLLIIATILISGYLIYLYTQKKELQWPLAIIIAGALGNVLDRMLYYPNGVLDFINVPFFSIFNIADSAITIGGIWLFFYLFLKRS